MTDILQNKKNSGPQHSVVPLLIMESKNPINKHMSSLIGAELFKMSTMGPYHK